MLLASFQLWRGQALMMQMGEDGFVYSGHMWYSEPEFFLCTSLLDVDKLAGRLEAEIIVECLT